MKKVTWRQNLILSEKRRGQRKKLRRFWLSNRMVKKLPAKLKKKGSGRSLEPKLWKQS